MSDWEEMIEKIKDIMEDLQWDFEFFISQALDRVDNLPVSLEDLNDEDAKKIIQFAKDMDENL